jgi:hypothetical protein
MYTYLVSQNSPQMLYTIIANAEHTLIPEPLIGLYKEKQGNSFSAD